MAGWERDSHHHSAAGAGPPEDRQGLQAHLAHWGHLGLQDRRAHWVRPALHAAGLRRDRRVRHRDAAAGREDDLPAGAVSPAEVHPDVEEW
ncbi:hypothetical protein [Amycolatopsis antarctica]|uniref:hypothetical protein n=1 Tax=Amycolatopsis antarctica TaxID=1854586 RepID=UPI0013FE20F3|nr:hypothetical protein [Amycolatopsis antarctica]